MDDSPHEPDPADVLASLEWDGRSFRRITTGWDNLIWRFETADGRSHVLRLYRGSHEGALRSAEAEATGQAAAIAAGLPVPAIEARGLFAGRPVFVIEWAEGKTLADLVKARPWRVVAIGREMGRLQARVHATPAPGNLRSWDHLFVERAVEHQGLREAVLAAARFETFCHLDFHPLNVLGIGSRPTAILDWTNVARSDLRIDLAYTYATLLIVPPPPGEPVRLINAARRLLARGWRAGYSEAAGAFPLDPLFEAFGAMRYIGEAERALREGRGWMTERHVEALHRIGERKLRAAGL